MNFNYISKRTKLYIFIKWTILETKRQIICLKGKYFFVLEKRLFHFLVEKAIVIRFFYNFAALFLIMKDIRLILILLVFVGIGACQAPSRHLLSNDIKCAEDSLREGKTEVVKHMVNQHLEEANDSDTYYAWLSMLNRVWYAEMKADSMESTSKRIYQYLSRHQQKRNIVRSQIEAEWYKARGVYFSALLGRPDSAVVYTQKALQIAESINYSKDFQLIALTNLAFFYKQLGQYDKSVDGYMQAMGLADSMDNSDATKPILLLGISSVYTSMGDYERSNYWWNQTSQLLPDMSKADRFIYYNDRGNDYYFQQEYAKARDCFSQAVALVKGDENKAWDFHTSLTNLGEVYVCLGKADSARIILQKADSFFRKVDLPVLLYYIETSKIKLEVQEGRTTQALSMMAHTEIADPKIPAAKVQRLKVKEQLMKLTGNYREAYETHMEMQAINDSLQSLNTSMQLSTRLSEYEHDKLLLEQQHSLDKARTDKLLAWGLFVLMVLVAIVLASFFLLYRRREHFNNLKTRQQIILMRMENTRNRITPHFIYNALNHEVLAQMEGREVDLNSLTQLLRRGVEQAGILQTTLAEELSFVDYYVNIEGRQMGADFQYSREVADNVDTNAVCLPSMIVQIFAENAIKHGLRPVKAEEGQQRRLTVRVTRKEQATLVEVIDNGKGLQSQMSNRTMTGSLVVKQTIQLLNDHNIHKITFGIGNWQHEGESGCRSWILLPDEYNYTITKVKF